MTHCPTCHTLISQICSGGDWQNKRRKKISIKTDGDTIRQALFIGRGWDNYMNVGLNYNAIEEGWGRGREKGGREGRGQGMLIT